MSPDKRHVTVEPIIPDGAKGEEHGPTVMLGVLPQLIGETDNRLSYFAGVPVPSSTAVKDTNADVLLCGTTVRFETVPGVPVGGGGVGLGGGGLGGVAGGGVTDPPPSVAHVPAGSRAITQRSMSQYASRPQGVP